MISKDPVKMHYSNTCIYHGKGANVNSCVYAPQDGENAGKFQGKTVFGYTAWMDTLKEAVAAIKKECKARDAAYKAKWGDTCLYPCSVCGKAKCKH